MVQTIRKNKQGFVHYTRVKTFDSSLQEFSELHVNLNKRSRYFINPQSSSPLNYLPLSCLGLRKLFRE